MKKLLLTLFVMLAFNGIIFAQQYDSYWPGFDYHAYDDHSALVAAIKIDGQIINITDEGWDALEVAFFVGDDCRGNENYLYNTVEEYGDPQPVIDGGSIFWTSEGEVVTVKMYDHLKGIEYTQCVVMYLDEEIQLITGQDHYEGWDDPENPVFLCFTSPETPGIPFVVTGYGDENSNTNYYLISSPIGEVSPTEVENMLDENGDYDLYYFDQSGVDDGVALEWRNYKPQHFDLEVGKGYL